MYAFLRRVLPPAWADRFMVLWYSALIILVSLMSLYAEQTNFPYANL